MAIIFHTLQNLLVALENLLTVYFCTQAHSMCIGSIVNVPTCRDQFVKTQIEQLFWFPILRKNTNIWKEMQIFGKKYKYLAKNANI